MNTVVASRAVISSSPSRGFGLGVIIQGLQSLLRINVAVLGDDFRFARPYNTLSVDLHAIKFSTLHSTGEFCVIHN